MRRKIIGAVLGLMACAGSLAALETGATIKKVDAKNGVVIVFAGGKERTLRVAKDAEFLDEKGKPLAGGLKSEAIKAGVEATLIVEFGRDNRPEIRVLRLGRARSEERRVGKECRL